MAHPSQYRHQHGAHPQPMKSTKNPNHPHHHAQSQLHPNAHVTKNTTYINRPDNFASLVSHIQFIHGDAGGPQENTVRVIEQYVRQKMMKMVIRARENMLRRIDSNQSSYRLSLADFTFLNKDRYDKLTRLHTFLSIKRHDMENRDDKHSRPYPLQIDRCLQHRGNLEYMESLLSNSDLQTTTSKSNEKPPRNMFLIRDGVDEDRSRAAKQLVKDMNQNEFNQYSKCGNAVFRFSQKREKFINWLCIAKMQFEYQPELLDCLSYLAYEMVALVTQTSLLVKRNVELYREDDTSKTISIVTGVLDDDWKRRLSTVHLEHDPSYEKAPSTRSAIQPGHVFEAIRRLESRDEMFSRHHEFL